MEQGPPPAAELAWGMAASEADAATFSSYLDFLTEDLGGLAGGSPLMDPSTLAAVHAAQASAPSEGARTRKRGRREESNSAAGEAGSAEDDEDGSDDDDEPVRGGKSKPRKGSAAAANKATREKARREKINDRFAELSKLVDPGSEPKTDKLSILQEAIRFVQQTQLEKQQTKLLNKFLEEKVQSLEKERSTLMYQVLQFTSMQQGMQGMLPGMLMQPGMPGMPPLAQPMLQLPPPAPGAPGTSASAAAGGQQPAALAEQQAAVQQPQPLQLEQQQNAGVKQEQQQQQLHQQQLQQREPASQQPQQAQPQQQAVPGLPMMLAAQQQAACKAMLAPSATQAMLPMPYWPSMMPASMLDSTQDSLLRPPAA